MPNSLVKSPEDEKLWQKSKAIATKAGEKDNYAYITGVYKKMKGIKESLREIKNLLEESDTGKYISFIQNNISNPKDLFKKDTLPLLKQKLYGSTFPSTKVRAAKDTKLEKAFKELQAEYSYLTNGQYNESIAEIRNLINEADEQIVARLANKLEVIEQDYRDLYYKIKHKLSSKYGDDADHMHPEEISRTLVMLRGRWDSLNAKLKSDKYYDEYKQWCDNNGVAVNHTLGDVLA